MKKMNRKGFTIVELVIVIAVIAILAGVLIPTFSGIVTKAQQSKSLQEVKNAYTVYVADTLHANGTPKEKIYVVFNEGKANQYFVTIDNGQAEVTTTAPVANSGFVKYTTDENEAKDKTLVCAHASKDNNTCKDCGATVQQ